MNTCEPIIPGAAAWAPPADAGLPAALSPFDVESLVRLANGFFAAHSLSPDATASGLTTPPSPATAEGAALPPGAAPDHSGAVAALRSALGARGPFNEPLQFDGPMRLFPAASSVPGGSVQMALGAARSAFAPTQETARTAAAGGSAVEQASALAAPFRDIDVEGFAGFLTFPSVPHLDEAGRTRAPTLPVQSGGANGHSASTASRRMDDRGASQSAPLSTPTPSLQPGWANGHSASTASRRMDDRSASQPAQLSTAAPPAASSPFGAAAAPAAEAFFAFPNVPSPTAGSESSAALGRSLAAAPGRGESAADTPSPSAAEAGVQPSLVADLSQGRRPLDGALVRRDFPILSERVNGRPLVWLDNAATTQKPNAVIDRVASFYRHENSNVHRAAHTLAARSTDAYEGAREKVRRFVNASSAREIVFVRGATEGVNLVAQSFGRRHIGAGDEVIVTWLEHHANIVPWQMLCSQTGARLKVAPVDDRGDVILEEYERLFTSRTKLAAIAHVSNALGTVNPVEQMVQIAHRHGARVLVDGAQSVSHMRVDVQRLGCDFYVFSGHKLYAPTGIGVVYGSRDALEATPPWQGGGNMISDVTFERTSYRAAPERYEAGTGNIADAVGLGAAIDYLEQFGMEAVEAYEHELMGCLLEVLASVRGLRILGSPRVRAGAVSFVLEGQRSEDVGAALDKEGIAVRSGHHCAQPILRRFGVEASVRPSLGIYNTRDDLEALGAALRRLQSPRA